MSKYELSEEQINYMVDVVSYRQKLLEKSLQQFDEKYKEETLKTNCCKAQNADDYQM